MILDGRPLLSPPLTLVLLLLASELLYQIAAVSSSASPSPSSSSSITANAPPSSRAARNELLSRLLLLILDDGNHDDVAAAPKNHPALVLEDEGEDVTKQPPKQTTQQRIQAMTSLSTESSKKIISSKTTFSSSSSSSHPSRNCIVFSDVDGTLVHYPTHLPSNDNGGSTKETITSDSNHTPLIHLPPSKTGSRGVISTKTLLMCHQLRHGIIFESGGDKVDDCDIADDIIKDAEGNNDMPVVIPLVLISGMRTSTLFTRLPYLPRSDAYVCESGGRIFYPRPCINMKENNISCSKNGYVHGLVVRPISHPGMPSGYETPLVLEEDMDWREQISKLDAAGSDGYDNNNVPPEHRRGKLWDFARTLIIDSNSDKYIIDADGYATAFRIRYSQNTTIGERSNNDVSSSSSSSLPPLPDGLACSTNLGCVDIYPTMSGKRNCAEYLARKLLTHEGGGGSILKTNAYCLCDDDNDIEMALACRAAYLPSVTSETMRALASSDENSLIVAEDETNGIVESLATEAALRALMEELQSLRK